MAVRPWVKELAGSWASFLTGRGLTFDAGPTHESILGEKYPVSVAIKAYQDAFLGQTPNGVYAKQFLHLMNFLNDFTSNLEEKMDSIMQREDAASCDELPPGLQQPCTDLQRWRARLDEYSMLVGSVPEDDEFDRTAVLWDVTAPLFLGWYGGETGVEVPLPEGGFVDGFNTDIQHPADIGTPYMLANQLGIAQAWNNERKSRFVEQFRPTLGLPRWGSVRNTTRNMIIAAGIGAAAFALLRK